MSVMINCGRVVRHASTSSSPFLAATTTWSDRIDRVLTHRYLGVPIFLAVMWVVLRVTADVTAPYLDWVDACKGLSNNVKHGTSSKTHCDFDYSGTMMEQMLLGLVAHRAGKRLEYDPVAGRVTNAPEANDYLKRTYREGWTLDG